MFTYPEILLMHAAERQRDLQHEASQYRLLAAARWARKSRRAAAKHRRPPTRSEPVGTLAAWAASGAQAR